MVVCDTEPVRLNDALRIFEDVFTRFGLLIAQDKTKMMVFHPETDYVPHIFEISAGILGYKVSSENAFRF